MKMNEKNFISKLKQKNEKALIYVIDQYGGLLKSIVQKHLFSLEECQEECLNDIFLGIWENIHTFDETKNTFKNWAAGVARYKSIDYKRKYLNKHPYEPLDENIAGCQTLEESILAEELSEELEELLSCLKQEDRQANITL